MDNEIQTTSQNTGVANFTKIETVIGDLVRGIAATEFDVSTGKGMRDACEVRLQIRTARINLGKAGKTAKRNLNTEKKRIDSEVDRLTALAYTGETPLHDMIRAEEDRKAEEKRLRDEAELERKGKIQKTIQAISGLPAQCARKTAKDLNGVLEYLDDYSITSFFDEFTEQAQNAKDAALTEIKAMLDSRLARDKEDAEREAETARLAEQKREQDERQAKMDAEQAEIDRKTLEAELEAAAIDEAKQEEPAETPIIAGRTKAFPEVPVGDLEPEEAPASIDSPVQDAEPEWVPVVRRAKKDVLRDILDEIHDLCLSRPEALERVRRIAEANLKASK